MAKRTKSIQDIQRQMSRISQMAHQNDRNNGTYISALGGYVGRDYQKAQTNTNRLNRAIDASNRYMANISKTRSYQKDNKAFMNGDMDAFGNAVQRQYSQSAYMGLSIG